MTRPKKKEEKFYVAEIAVKIEGRCENGYFIEPTVIEGLGHHCETNTEEIFGPVVTLQSFNTEDEALELANACNYGLAATIWTQDISEHTV